MEPGGGRGGRTHVLRLEDVADHPVETSVVLSRAGLGRLVQVFLSAVRTDHLPPSHQNHHVPNVGDVRNGSERKVH